MIELRAWRGQAEVILVPDTVVINQNLDVAGPAGTVSGEARTEADWKASLTPQAWAFHDAFIAWTQANLGEIRVDYSPKSYVGIRRGRRVWAPPWFRRDGATTYLPDPDGLRGEVQSPAMDDFRERLRKEGLETSWQPTYNAGANPVPLRLRQADLGKPVVQELLRATFEILDPALLRGQNDTRNRPPLLPPPHLHPTATPATPHHHPLTKWRKRQAGDRSAA